MTPVCIFFVTITYLLLVKGREKIDSFSGDNEYLKGVALISERNKNNHRKWKPLCTGSHIRTPQDADPQYVYVLSAAHCFWENRIEGQWLDMLNDTNQVTDVSTLAIGDYKVEFGVTEHLQMSQLGIITCRIFDIIIDFDFVFEKSYYRSDFAIVKAQCHGTPRHPFTIEEMSDIEIDQTNGFIRAGYGRTRQLYLYEHEHLKQTNNVHKRFSMNLVYHDEEKELADSGGPLFNPDTHHLQAIYIASPKRKVHEWGQVKEIGVRITDDAHEKIDDMARGQDGLSYFVNECEDTMEGYKEKQCWTKCTVHRLNTELCFASKSQTRLFARTGHVHCKVSGATATGYKYLCGAIRDCVRSDSGKKCLGNCVRSDSGKTGCDGNGLSLSEGMEYECVDDEEESFDGMKFVCKGKKEVKRSSALRSLYNLLMQLYTYDFYEDYNGDGTEWNSG